MNADQIKQLLQAELSGCEVHVEVEGSHCTVTAIGDIFEGVRPVKRQQMVYAGLSQQIADGSLHAVNIKALTPAEHSQ
ncbi:BolA family protein [Dasania marina]|uniref:BolA family protein n=1 Tax=Dasania marina TaxID=471499 RepID=UPI00047820D3|nr:BolA/IbaG family iron-sulfur metabolism protein [Dasania marina]